jgi:hypothetical protein
MKARPWSCQEDEILLGQLSVGRTLSDCGAALGRTSDACARRVWRLVRNMSLRRFDERGEYVVAYIRTGRRVRSSDTVYGRRRPGASPQSNDEETDDESHHDAACGHRGASARL